ncbi:MAG: family 10 glycosylhydrolase [Armatimonadota bacterium]
MCVAAVVIVASVFAAEHEDWTWNVAFSQWRVSNKYDRYHTFTAESADERAKELADAGYGAAIISGYHFRLNFLDRDDDIRRITRTIADACHDHNLKLIEHCDMTVHFYDGYEQMFKHPDWLQLLSTDMVLRFRIYCLNNPEFRKFYTDYFRRFQQDTNIDGYQMDEVNWIHRSTCGCRFCREKYETQTGRPFPPTYRDDFWADTKRPLERRQWLQWRSESSAEFTRFVADELRQIKPALQFSTYTTAHQCNPYARGGDYATRVAAHDFAGTEINDVPFLGYPAVYSVFKQRAALGDLYDIPIWGKVDSVMPHSAYFAWALNSLARQSMWWSLKPEAEDPSAADLLKWPWRMDNRTARQRGEVGVVLSSSSRDMSSERSYYYNEFEGWLQALLLNNVATKVIVEKQIDGAERPFEDCRLVIVPNASVIRPEQGRKLLEYAKDGGKLLLTADTGTLTYAGEWDDSFLRQAAGVQIEPVPVGAHPTRTIAVDLQPAGEFDISVRKVTGLPGAAALASCKSGDESLPLITLNPDTNTYYLAAKLGCLAFEPKQLPASKRKGGYQPPADARAIEAIGGLTRTILGQQPLFAIENAPRGLISGVYRTEREGRPAHAVHLLNCTGRDLEPGDPVEFHREGRLPTPDLPEMTVTIPGDINEASLATPERDIPLSLSVANEGGVARVTVPAGAFSLYGVIWAYE